MINALSCTVQLWMHFGDVLGGLLSSQELEENFIEVISSMGICSTLALLNLIRRIFQLCYKLCYITDIGDSSEVVGVGVT